MQSGSFGKPIAVYNRYKILEDATKEMKTGETIYSGRPVTLSAAHDAYDGQIIAVAANGPVYGLSKVNKNVYSDEVTGTSTGMYGSGMVTTIVEGIVDIQPNVFTLSDGSEVTVPTYATALTYYPWNKLYVELTDAGTLGQITNVGATANDETFLGWVLVPPTSTNTTMQILLRCGTCIPPTI
jgi:hypothetical protein